MKKEKRLFEEMMATARERGAMMTEWECPHCGETQSAFRPRPQNVTKERPYSRACTMCFSCGEQMMLEVHVGGGVKIEEL